MNKDLTLLVLAAGMGSRFGGLKQIEPVGPHNEFIIDYSVYDAIKAGFTKIVFVIKKENYDIFKETIGKRIEDKIKVAYVFQDILDVPEGINIPKDRIKPLGTAHAVYAARNEIHEPFAIINADDFYGRDAYLVASNFLRNCGELDYANVSYKVSNTLTKNGAVKRGLLFNEDGYITNIVESSIEEVNGKIECTPLKGGDKFIVEEDMPVSMNMFCLTPKLFEYIKNNMTAFFQNAKDLMTDEYLIPDVAFKSSIENNKKMKLLTTDSKYYGMTYKEDLEELKDGIRSEIEKGNYKENLWG